MAFIYAYENLINGKRYIGATIRKFNIRKNEEFSRLRHNKSGLPKLQNGFNKYGELGFKYYIIAICNDCDTKDFENYFQKCWDTIENGYNCEEPSAIFHFSQEYKNKMSKKLMGKNKGKTRTIECRRLISDKIKEGFRNGRIPWNKGGHHSQESINKMIESKRRHSCQAP